MNLKNQNWLEQNFPKNSEEIDISYEKFENSSLIIEDYPNLNEIDASDCKLDNLIIRNCPNLIKLNVCRNNLTSLEFIKDLEKLLNLEINGNEEISSGLKYLPNSLNKFTYKGTKLFKLLESHNQDWKSRKKYLQGQEINEEQDNLKELLTLKEENKKLELKNKLFKEKFQELSSLITSLKSNNNNPRTTRIIELLEKNVRNIVDENQKMKDELEQFKPLFDNEEPILEGTKLGKGGSGDVWLGSWKTQFVAVKKPINITNEINLEKIKNELKFLKNLRSKYTIQYYGEYRKESDFYIIMEYAENGSLDKFIQDNKDKPHDWELNKRLILQIVKGLYYLHSEGVIHRDLKSPNILLTKENIVKISDFGLSKVILDISEEHDYSESKPTISLRWIAPEVLEGKYSKYSDIYSLGVVIWEVCAKSKPFAGINEKEVIISRIASGKTNEIPQDTPSEFKEIIENCWKAKPNERIKIEEIISQLDTGRAKTTFYPFISELNQGTSTLTINEKSILEKINKIKKGLEKLKSSLEVEPKELVEVDQFITVKKQSLRNKTDKEIGNNVWELEENLEDEGIKTQVIERLAKYCEELVILEQQLEEQGKLQANVEMPK